MDCHDKTLSKKDSFLPISAHSSLVDAFNFASAKPNDTKNLNVMLHSSNSTNRKSSYPKNSSIDNKQTKNSNHVFSLKKNYASDLKVQHRNDSSPQHHNDFINNHMDQEFNLAQDISLKTKSLEIPPNYETDDAEQKFLCNLKALESLLLKIFSDGSFSIEEFALSVPELHILVEILIRKNKSASRNRFVNKSWKRNNNSGNI